MNHLTHTFGDATSVAQRFGSETGITRPEKLLDVLVYNNTGGTLFMQVHEIDDGLIPNGSVLNGGGSYLLTGLTIGHTYFFQLGANDSTINGLANAGTFVAGGTSVAVHGTPGALVTAYVIDLTTPHNSQVPLDGSVPKFSFPVQSNLGGTLGRSCDSEGIYCCWSSTQATKTIASASGSIAIIVKA